MIAVVLLVTCLQVQPKALSPVDILRRLQGWSVDYDAVSSHHARAEDSPFNKPLVSPASGEYALERGSIPRGEESPKREEQSPPRGENPVKGSAKEKDGAREKGPAKKDAAQEKSPNPDRGSREAVQPDLFTSGSSFPFLPRAGERRVIVDEAALVDLQEKPGAWGISDMEDLQYLKKYLSHFDQNFGEKIRSHVPSEWGEEKRSDEKYTAETHEPFRVAPRSDNDTLVFYSDPRRPSAFRDVAVPLAVSFEDDNSDLPYQEPSLVCRALGRSYCSVDEDHPSEMPCPLRKRRTFPR
ncbi:unnamed protein product [Darwinula stevensoni]|uniref:Uncharacterized protein n=1 Tax=Darwinula stevensoni TaxID=69355 RepID=A0A7R8XC92_9CRUS|nr:unnamed protein product [Darwinula stevensoni]CAG0891763.1 unnamed protein product [Darwinula stevensoni]